MSRTAAVRGSPCAKHARCRDERLEQQPQPAGEAAVGLLRHLQIVVVEADQPERERHAEHDPHIGVLRVRPQHGRNRDTRQDHQPAHRRRAALRHEMRRRPVLADRLTLALAQAQVIDDPRTEQEHEHERGHHRAAGAHRQIAEHVEHAESCPKNRPANTASFNPAALVRLRCARSGACSALTIGPMREPSEPLTITASPAVIAPSTCGSERGRRFRIAAAALGGKRIPQRFHQRAGAIDEIDRIRRYGLGERGMQHRAFRPKLQHVAEHRDAPAEALSPAPARAAPARRASRSDWRCSSRRSAAPVPPGTSSVMRSPRPTGGLRSASASAASARSAPSKVAAASTPSELSTTCRPGAPSL